MTSFGVESYIWYGFTLAMVFARMVSRLLHFKSVLRLQVEDWLMVFLTCLYTILIVFLNIDLKVSTNLIDPAHPVDLTPHEIDERTWGSKTILLVEQCMCAVQWGTKACLLLLYWRLTQNLKQSLIVKCAAVYVAGTYIIMEILYFAVWCRPFRDYWQTPTENKQCNTALNHLITNLVFNLTSDVLIMSIPLPLFIRAQLEFKKKLLLIFPFSLGLFTMLCAILSKQKSFTQPYSSAWVYWYCREASTAMIVTNMPYSWALIRRIFKLRSFFGDSTAANMQGGHGGQLNGYSAGAVALSSGPRSRQTSKAGESAGKFSLHRLKRDGTQSGQHDDIKTYEGGHDGFRSAENKDIKAHTVAPSSTTSSDGSVKQQSAVQPTQPSDMTLDRLYPLDDIEAGTQKITRRHHGFEE